MHVIHADNINDAYQQGHALIRDHGVVCATRAGTALVVPDPVTTVYENPCERVLMDPKRDANPFFHFFEALWMLAGKRDVATLAYFNANMANYSDNGDVFHAAYGYRLRQHFGVDQLAKAIHLLKTSYTSRQVMLQIWDPVVDLGATSKDIPCNDMLKLRIVNGKLDIMVFCRSNDMVWGAYGANIVQFSTLQEYIAGAVGVGVGKYYQISCDYHAYADTYAKCGPPSKDPVFTAVPYSMFNGCDAEGRESFLVHVEEFMHTVHVYASTVREGQGNFPWESCKHTPAYLIDVAIPMFDAWLAFKCKDNPERIGNAVYLLNYCKADDWRAAGTAWLLRRGGK